MNLHEALNLIHQCLRSNQFDPAENLCRQILAADPDQPDALYFLGLICRQKGLIPQAIEFLQKSLSIRPNVAEIHYTLGNLHKLVDQNDPAISAYQNALALNPDLPLAWYNLGVSLQDIDRYNDAINAFQNAIALKPDLFLAHVNLANALHAIGQYDPSIQASLKALSINPAHFLPYNNLANAYISAGQLDQALQCCSQALQFVPQNPESHSLILNNMGNIYNMQGLLDPAIDCYEKATALNPAFPLPHANLILMLHYSIRHTAADIQRQQQIWNQRHAQPLSAAATPPVVDPNPNRPLRVGFVSPDFHNHPITRFIPPLFNNLDPGQFEIFVYSDLFKTDATHPAIRQSVHPDRWRDSHRLTRRQFVEQVRSDRIDILFDLASHSGGNRLLDFALKPAPIQITWLAYSGSTGLPAMDYRISDPLMDPPGLLDLYYCEKTALLPDCYWCYSPPPEAPNPAFPSALTFGSFNNACKINDAVLSLWAKILIQLPQASLLFFLREGPFRNIILDKFRSLGADPAQIRFFDRLPAADYYALYNQVHIALDPFPFNGGTTTCDALYMGVPVVSRVYPDRAVGRAGLSLLSQVGLCDLAAQSDDAYVNTAVQLAQNTPRLRDLRFSLRQTMLASPLMDAPRFARNFGNLLRKIWTHHDFSRHK